VGAFNSVKPLLKDLKTCKVVKTWDEVDPVSSKGSQVFVIQLAHGGPGGHAFLNNGEQSPEQIISKIQSLASLHRLGLYIDSCYSGDLIGRFISLPEQAQRNACLITTSVFNRESQAGSPIGPRSKVPQLLQWMNGQTRKSLSTFFEEESDQGLISGANWEAAGFSRLIEKRIVGIDILNTVNAFVTPGIRERRCDRYPNSEFLPLEIKMACGGVEAADIIPAAMELFNEEFRLKANPYQTGPADLSFYKSLNFESAIFDPIRKISIFKDNPNFKTTAEKCLKESKTPLACTMEALLPKSCQPQTKLIEHKLADMLLGIDKSTESLHGISDDLDLANFLFRFSKGSYSEKTLRTPLDQDRKSACDSFLLGSSQP